ncbi:Integrase catalytic domain-containing protein [Mycena kentingensis (nom. inval.)]|nr:Integrase catalytic domain-containing protein [Mycena kentingensis (nom. inval.)]
MAAVPLPARGSHSAPKFDPAKPEELRRYFQDVEFALESAQITPTAAKKKAATRYLPVADAELLEGLDEYTDVTKTYEEFKKAALALYAGNDDEHLHTLRDWDALLGSTARLGIQSQKDLLTFYRDFSRISTFLLSKNRLSETERSHAFLRALQPASLQLAVRQRLQIVRPNVHVDDPYTLTDLYDAAKFALAGTASTQNYSVPLGVTAKPTVKRDPDLAALVGAVAQLVQAMSLQSKGNVVVGGQAAGMSNQRAKPGACAYCDESGHFARECPNETKDKAEGLCKRNAEGKIVLPNNSFVPRAIEGRNLRERIVKWHQLNPGQKSTTQLIVGLPLILSRLATLTTEINAVRTRLGARRALDAAQNAKGGESTIPQEDLTPSSAPATTTEPAAASSGPAHPAAPPTASKKDIPGPPSFPMPEHPFAAAKDAAYAPPKVRNAGAAPKAPARPQPPIYNSGSARAAFEAVMDSPVTMTSRQLLAISPEVCALARDSVTPRRQTEAQAVPQVLVQDEDPFAALFGYEPDPAAKERERAFRVAESLPDTFATAARSRTPPTDALIAPDPLVALYDQGRLPQGLVASAETKAIRCILPVVDHQEHIESIVDPGSQICAMSEAVCHRLAIPYDPTVVLQMQSANGAITPSLGLARNVAFQIRDITLYLQMHVVRNPAYDILLGRPFDVLTQSVVHNYGNDDQTLTLLDPNTGSTVTVPTIPRGSSRTAQQDFLQRRSSASKL